MKKTETTKKHFSMIVHPERVRAEARRILNTRYTEEDGWIVNSTLSWQPHLPDFIIDRYCGRNTERVVAVIIFEEQITHRHINRIDEISSRLTGHNFLSAGKIIIVPEGCDTSLIHSDTEILAV
ncbi:MAG: hypothetical protein WCM76_01365 [Bacteroidota bacterium]